jgi:hypothetical protein
VICVCLDAETLCLYVNGQFVCSVCRGGAQLGGLIVVMLKPSGCE